MTEALIGNIAAVVERWGDGTTAEELAREILALVADEPWTPFEVDRGARAAVEKIRLEQREQNQKQANARAPVSISNPEKLGLPANGKIIQPAYKPLTDKEWMQFRNLPICAQMLINVKVLFNVLKRVNIE